MYISLGGEVIQIIKGCNSEKPQDKTAFLRNTFISK